MSHNKKSIQTIFCSMENEEIVLNLAGISELFCRFLKQFSVVIFFINLLDFINMIRTFSTSEIFGKLFLLNKNNSLTINGNIIRGINFFLYINPLYSIIIIIIMLDLINKNL